MSGERVDGVPTVAAQQERAPEHLIAARLRQTAAAGSPSRPATVAPPDVERWLSGDAGHLHRAGDLTVVPVVSHRRVARRIVVPLKRTTRRLLFPLLEVQTGVNAANARVVTFLLEQIAAQAGRIGELEQQVAELRAERER